MAKKRFTFHHDVDGIDYIQDETNGFCLICDKLLCNLLNELNDENEQLKKDRFICLDCKYCGYTEIGCLCEKQDCWEDFKSECNDFKELKYYDGDVE